MNATQATGMQAIGQQSATHSLAPATDVRQRAEKTAEQFEAILVRQLVSSLRQTASFGEEGGLFGSGTGSDTYADWFDQHLSEHIGKSKQVGVKQAILDGIDRAGQLGSGDASTGAAGNATSKAAAQATFALQAADRSRMAAAAALQGGLDVTL